MTVLLYRISFKLLFQGMGLWLRREALTDRVLEHRAVVSGILGAACAFAGYDGQIWVADSVLLILVLVLGRRPHLPVAAITLCIAATSPWSTVHYMPLWAGVRILALSSVWRGLKPDMRATGLGATAVMLPQALALLVFAPGFAGRPAGFTETASTLGEHGLMLFSAAFAVVGGFWVQAGIAAVALITLGFSESRSAALSGVALVGLYVLHKRWAVAAVVGLAVLGAGVSALFMWQENAERSRFNWQDIETTWESRLDNWEGGPISRANLLNAAGVPYPDVDAMILTGAIFTPIDLADYPPELGVRAVPDYHKPRLSLAGYGYYDYVRSTGVQGPHNVFVLASYEMGLLALVVLGAAVWAVWARAVPWQAVLVLGGLWMLSDIAWADPEGHYITAFMLGAMAVTFQPKKR